VANGWNTNSKKEYNSKNSKHKWGKKEGIDMSTCCLPTKPKRSNSGFGSSDYRPPYIFGFLRPASSRGMTKLKNTDAPHKKKAKSSNVH
jgi:hypothetical protein